MKYYLSSFKLGNTPEKYLNLFSDEQTVAYIPNATDFTGADPCRVKAHINGDVEGLESLGLNVKLLDLKDYFDQPQKDLEDRLSQFSGLWVSGGNVFVLRQAMKLSGLDKILLEKSEDDDFVYGGYSAGCCVLSESLKPYQVASDASDLPYPMQKEVIWGGLGLIDFAFMPHFQSDHSESNKINDEFEYCISNKIAYRTVI